MKTKLPAPPSHLRPETAEWWQSVVSEFVLDAHHLRILGIACEAWDSAATAREALATHGQTYTDNRTEKETSARLSVARIAEKEAYSALQAHRHREAVRAALAMEIKLHDALNQERAIRAEVIDREGGMFSCSLPFFARYGYDPAITQARLSEARAAGYIDANETGFKL